MSRSSLIWVALTGVLVAEADFLGLLTSIRYGTMALDIAAVLTGIVGAAFFIIGYRFRQLSITDDGTDLYNRRYLFHRLERELRTSNNNGNYLSMIVIDVDDFRRYNNVYGHLVGDAVLRQVASTLQRCVRKGDVVGRWGGEEFALILPKANIDEALTVAERIRLSINQLRIEMDGQEIDPITISAGVASNDSHGKTVPELVNSADMAMYAAKQQKDLVLAANVVSVSRANLSALESTSL